MKICPTCRRTYEDDGLNFCLEDGSVLNFTASEAAQTLLMGQQRPTDPTSRDPRMPTGAAVPDATIRSIQPTKKSSRAWVLVLGIFALLALLCGGSIAGFFFYVASGGNMSNGSPKGPAAANSKNTNTFTRTSPGASPSGPSDVKEVDLSGWVEDPTQYLDTEFADDEFFMTSKQSGYYYVLVAKKEEFKDAPVARVTVRNSNDGSAELGYGLVFHSDITPLTNDYAFLIDTRRKKYRVVRHEAEQEKTITAWTSSNLIKSGSELNTLEARDNGEKIGLYINGQLATTIGTKDGPRSGVPGLYVGNGAKVGFRKLEVVK